MKTLDADLAPAGFPVSKLERETLHDRAYLELKRAIMSGAIRPGATITIRAMAAATDNIGVFFGEDIFLAIGSILLMVGFLAQSGIVLEPLQLSVWAIPTAIAAFLIHGARLMLFGRRQRATAREDEA